MGSEHMLQGHEMKGHFAGIWEFAFISLFNFGILNYLHLKHRCQAQYFSKVPLIYHLEKKDFSKDAWIQPCTDEVNCIIVYKNVGVACPGYTCSNMISLQFELISFAFTNKYTILLNPMEVFARQAHCFLANQLEIWKEK